MQRKELEQYRELLKKKKPATIVEDKYQKGNDADIYNKALLVASRRLQNVEVEKLNLQKKISDLKKKIILKTK